ncbi:glycosyltransferase family 4 protein [Poriferisphaera sp. WC338]|uniref:glycosyltransferase family 4 protein n=1 Tax=Poriferisphaera sp. WC338 TaxID=3425129 RepID=UPI003D819BDF
MKILMLAPHAFYIDRGTPIDVDILVRALSELGHEVDLLVYHQGEDRSYPGLRIFRTKGSEKLGEIGPGFSGKKLKCDKQMYVDAVALAKANRYDVVHAGEEAVFMAMRLKKKFGLPYVYDMDSSIAQQMVEKFGFLKPVAWGFNAMERRAVRGAMAVSPVCHALADLARKHGAVHVETLHDISQLKPSDLEHGDALRMRLKIEGAMLLYVGNLERYQGVDLLLESMVHVHAAACGARLVIAGGSDEHIGQYEKKAAALGIGEAVHFIGRVPVSGLGGLLSQADVLVAPRTMGVNTPQKIFPYMHTGKPVVVTDLPTHTQLLDDEVVALGEAEPRGFAKAIIDLVNDPAKQKQLGEAGRRFVEENHTYPAHLERVRQLYDYVAGRLSVETVAGQASIG